MILGCLILGHLLQEFYREEEVRSSGYFYKHYRVVLLVPEVRGHLNEIRKSCCFSAAVNTSAVSSVVWVGFFFNDCGIIYKKMMTF